jgi:hypothetical protein
MRPRREVRQTDFGEVREGGVRAGTLPHGQTAPIVLTSAKYSAFSISRSLPGTSKPSETSCFQADAQVDESVRWAPAILHQAQAHHAAPQLLVEVHVAVARRDMAIRGVLTTPLPADPVSPLQIALGQPHPLEPGGMALKPRGLAADLRHLEVPLACSRLLPLLGTPRQGQQRKCAGGPSRTHRSVPRNAVRSSMAKRCEVEPCSPVAGTHEGMLAVVPPQGAPYPRDLPQGRKGWGAASATPRFLRWRWWLPPSRAARSGLPDHPATNRPGPAWKDSPCPSRGLLTSRPPWPA